MTPKNHNEMNYKFENYSDYSKKIVELSNISRKDDEIVQKILNNPLPSDIDNTKFLIEQYEEAWFRFNADGQTDYISYLLPIQQISFHFPQMSNLIIDSEVLHSFQHVIELFQNLDNPLPLNESDIKIIFQTLISFVNESIDIATFCISPLGFIDSVIDHFFLYTNEIRTLSVSFLASLFWDIDCPALYQRVNKLISMMLPITMSLYGTESCIEYYRLLSNISSSPKFLLPCFFPRLLSVFALPFLNDYVPLFTLCGSSFFYIFSQIPELFTLKPFELNSITSSEITPEFSSIKSIQIPIASNPNIENCGLSDYELKQQQIIKQNQRILQQENEIEIEEIRKVNEKMQAQLKSLSEFDNNNYIKKASFSGDYTDFLIFSFQKMIKHQISPVTINIARIIETSPDKTKKMNFLQMLSPDLFNSINDFPSQMAVASFLRTTIENGPPFVLQLFDKGFYNFTNYPSKIDVMKIMCSFLLRTIKIMGQNTDFLKIYSNSGYLKRSAEIMEGFLSDDDLIRLWIDALQTLEEIVPHFKQLLETENWSEVSLDIEPCEYELCIIMDAFIQHLQEI